MEAIDRLEYIHKKGFIHRNIKPANFLIGTAKRTEEIFLIDFATTKRFIDPQTSVHITFKEDKVGSSANNFITFQSLHATLCHVQSRRDDLESLGYILAYFINGGVLPWMQITPGDKKWRETVAEIKAGYPHESLFNNSKYGRLYVSYMKYCRDLPFEKDPNYGLLRNIFRKVL